MARMRRLKAIRSLPDASIFMGNAEFVPTSMPSHTAIFLKLSRHLA
jgi:hypothetical protein